MMIQYPCHEYPCHMYPCYEYPCHEYPCHMAKITPGLFSFQKNNHPTAADWTNITVLVGKHDSLPVSILKCLQKHRRVPSYFLNRSKPFWNPAEILTCSRLFPQQIKTISKPLQKHWHSSLISSTDQNYFEWVHYSRLLGQVDFADKVGWNDAVCVSRSQPRQGGTFCACCLLLWQHLLIFIS